MMKNQKTMIRILALVMALVMLMSFLPTLISLF